MAKLCRTYLTFISVASGLTIGFTGKLLWEQKLMRGFMILASHTSIGSYIFSQTIFTCRSRTNSRWVGILVACSFLGVIVSTVNVLEVTPLFFLGSTLIFIGTDLLYEWVSRPNFVHRVATCIYTQTSGIRSSRFDTGFFGPSTSSSWRHLSAFKF